LRISSRSQQRPQRPDKIDLYDLIYEPRFRRLKEQFRE